MITTCYEVNLNDPAKRDALIPNDIAKTLVDVSAYADDRITEAHTWLRKNNPLGLAVLEGYYPFWVATKHADIMEISKNNDLFPIGDNFMMLNDLKAEEITRKVTGGKPYLIKTIPQMDKPEHPKYRAISQSWFMPANVRKLEDKIREMARETVEKMASYNGECDFVEAVALGYPLHVIMDILGVPEKDEPLMLALTQQTVGANDDDLRRNKGAEKGKSGGKGIQSILEDFTKYFSRIGDDRRAHPKDDLASVIANAEIDGKPISPNEEMGYFVSVATAGHDTTSSSAATAIWQLCENPEEFAKVKADPSLIPGLVDEAIRWMTPIKHFMRTAAEDTELCGRQISKGERIMMCYPSANRDEDVFEDPFKFRVDRKQNKHLAFGYGAHLCLGMHLARLEIKVFLEELLSRLESIELTGPVKISQSIALNGPKTVPIRYKMA